MPIHDWSRVGSGVFHHFHLEWIGDLSRVLNRGLLPPEYYALAGRPDRDECAAKARTIAIRHVSRHQIIAMIEIVSPGNKDSSQALRAFVDKASQALRTGINLVAVDLFSPGRCDSQGIHKAIWAEFIDDEFTLPLDKPLTLASYIGGPAPQAFIEPTAVGDVLAVMPLFLTPEVYVHLPLEETYESAWEAVPSFYRELLTAPDL